jgi:hypothetical protein
MPKGIKHKKPMTGILPELLEGNLFPIATIVKGKDGKPTTVKIEYVELPEGMTYGDFLMIRTAQAAAVKSDATARRDVKEWVEGKTPEAPKQAEDDGTNEDADDLEHGDTDSFPDPPPQPS